MRIFHAVPQLENLSTLGISLVIGDTSKGEFRMHAPFSDATTLHEGALPPGGRRHCTVWRCDGYSRSFSPNRSLVVSIILKYPTSRSPKSSI